MTAAWISAQHRRRAVPAHQRRRAAAALATVAVGVATLLIALQSGGSAAAAPPAVPARAAAPVTTTAGALRLTVDPAGGLTAAGATLKIAGSGFDPGTGIYVAICHADGKAPASLRDCVGGPVPTANQSRSWAHISNKAGPADGARVVAWGDGGSFAVQLPLPASNSASDALDCTKVPCAVYTASDSGDTAENLSVPLATAAPVTTPPTASTTASSTTSSTLSTTASSSTTSSSAAPSSAAPSSAPASSTPASSSPQFSTSSATAPTTVQAKSVRSPTIVAGGVQEVLFAGFAKNEPVTVTLYSAPQALPAARADPDGVVKIDFTVPADLEPATHLLRVVGQNSKVTGIASFIVTAPVVPSSAAVLPSTPATTTTSPARASSAVLLPATVPTASSAASTATVTSAAAVALPPAASGRTVWPWYALGALLAILAAVVAYLLNRRSRLAAERRDNDALLADAAAAEHERNLDAVARANADAPTAYLGGAAPGVAPPVGGYTGYHPGEHGLLSGRDHPDNPGMLSGTGYRGFPAADQPTTALPAGGTARPDERTTFLPAEPPPEGAGSGGPATGSWRPDFDDAPDGPATGVWRPDFDDADPAGPDSAGRDPADHDPAGRNSAGQATSGDRPPEQPAERPEDPESGGRHTRPS